MDYRYNIKLSSGSFFYFSEKFKNLKPFFEDFWSWIKGLFEKGKDFLSVFSKSTRETYERLGIEIKKARKSPVIGSAGGAIKTLLEEGKYALMKEGKEIFRGTQKEVEELAEKLKGMSDEAAEKYLDEILERRKIFLKWADKFEKKFHHHFDGEIVVGKWSKRDGTPTLWSQGAHNHTINGRKINIKEIRSPIVSRIEDIPNDVPFKANVEVIYSNRNIPKQNTSSFFPKNWNINRIKEEISLVYDEMIQSGFELKYSNNKYFTTNRKGFNILIEVDDLGNLTNAYPLI